MIVGNPIARAKEAVEFSRGLDEAGLSEIARRHRVLAGDVLELAEALAAEQSARAAIQAARDNAVAILERQAGEAAARAAR